MGTLTISNISNPQFQVFNPIVVAYSILMVHRLTDLEFTS